MRPDLGYEALRHLTDEVVFIHDEERRILFVSPSVEHVLGWSENEFREMVTTELVHPDDMPAAFRAAIQVRSEPGASYRSVLRVLRKDGGYVWCETVGRNLLHTEVAGIVNSLRDVSERRALEEKLFELAFQDGLTELPNRRAFVHHLELALEEDDGRIGVMILDVDGFKGVNDRLGHVAGDALLTASADGLRSATRGGDLAARLGGDEFAVLCRDVRGEGDLRARAEAIRLSAPAGSTPHAEGPGVTFSVGAALGRHGDAVTDLLSAADRALYAAKRGGRDRVSLAPSGDAHPD